MESLNDVALSAVQQRLGTDDYDKDVSYSGPKSMHQDDGIMLYVFENLDVVTLIQKKQVCKRWKGLLTKAIDDKCTPTNKKKFQSNDELREAVDKFYGSEESTNMQLVNIPGTANNVEAISSKYGYPMNDWDVSNVQDFSNVFRLKYLFNEDIGSWNVSNASTMYQMFAVATKFNQDISSWDVSSVTNMVGIFMDAHEFNKDISTWNVSRVTIGNGMFGNAHSFNQCLSSWDVSNMEGMGFMFYGASSFNQDISGWDVSSAKTMTHMFCGASKFNQDISSWDVTNVTCFYAMFRACNCRFVRQLPWFVEGEMEY